MPVWEVDGAPLVYDDEGAGPDDQRAGPVVVLLHAGIADRRMWAPLAAALAGRFRVVRYDIRGYGESRPPPPSFAHHEDLAGLLDHLGIARAALVGCSFGGAVAIDTALAYPDRVAALGLLGSVVSGYRWADLNGIWDRVIGEVDEDDLDALAAAEVRLWVVGPDRDPSDVDPGLVAFAVAMNRDALAAEAALEDVDVRYLKPLAVDRLGEIAAPALVTAGAEDLPEVRALADRLAAGIPLAQRLPDIPDAGHLLPLERPEPVAEALSTFLSGTR